MLNSWFAQVMCNMFYISLFRYILYPSFTNTVNEMLSSSFSIV